MGGGSEPIKIGTPFIIGSIEVSGTVYPVYRKIVDCGALPNNNSKDTPSGVTPNRIISMYGMAVTSAGSYNAYITIPYITTTAQFDTQLQYINNNIRIVTKTDLSGYSALVTIDYY